MNYVNLYTNLPSINSQYTIKVDPKLTVRYKPYNNFPEPKVVKNDSLIYVQFSMDNLKGIVENEHNCLPCEKPYLYYSLENESSTTRTWKDVYNEEFNLLTQPIALDYEKSSYYKRWKRRIIGPAKDSSKYYKLSLLHNEVLNNFKMQPLIPEEFIKSSGYFLKEKRFDPNSIRRFYRQILEDLDIKYWAVFGKTKHSGIIDTDYIRKGEFDHVFFAFKNEKGFLRLLYPHKDFFMYQANEIPISLYNTKAVLVKPQLKRKKNKRDKFISRDLNLSKVDSVSISVVNLPGMDSNNNYIHQTFSANVNSKQNKTPFKCIFKISGGLSTEIRSFHSMLDKNKEVSDMYDAFSEFEADSKTLLVDTITYRKLNKTKPFTYKLNYEGKLNDAITFINDSLINISVDKLIQHSQLESSTNNSELDYYLNYSYADKLSYYINFPSSIEVLGIKNSFVDFKNEFGEYFFKLIKSKDNQLLLRSNYKIIKEFIPKEKLNGLELLNDQTKKTKNKRLIVKLKKLSQKK